MKNQPLDGQRDGKKEGLAGASFSTRYFERENPAEVTNVPFREPLPFEGSWGLGTHVGTC